MKRIFIAIILVSTVIFAYSEGLDIEAGEVYVEFTGDDEREGFHIWIRDNEEISSVMMIESSKDPEGVTDSFAFRAYDWNPVNGDEKRVLDGEFLGKDNNLYFIIDSTTEYNETFGGEAYHLYVPINMTYGYPWSRQGQVQMSKGTWINLRTFTEPYADYRGEYRDNPFILDMKELPPPEKPAAVIEESENIMDKIARTTAGDFASVKNPEEALERIAEVIDSFPGGNIDIALVIDTTVSMQNDVEFLRKKLIRIVESRVEKFDRFRIGLVFYRDYKEAYLTKEIDFTSNMEIVQYWFDKISVHGGRDLREAVYEGLYSALTNLDWISENRLIIQVGDALPHKEPKGEITEDMVYSEASVRGVSIYPILLPDESGSGE